MVNVAASGDWTVHGPTRFCAKAMANIRPQLPTPLFKLFQTGNPVIHSPAVVPSRWPERINASDADVVNLHWVQGEMLSIADISRIQKPIVWTLHDMWAFCGAEHYTTDYRWRDSYLRDNRPAYEGGYDLNRSTWQRKRKYWRMPMQIVCPSHWLADCVRDSALMHDWPVEVVPYPIDLNTWKTIDQRLARHLFGLPQDCPLLLFGAIGGGQDSRKGIDLLLAALHHLRTVPNLQTLQLVVFGQHAPQSPTQIGFPVHYIGHLNDDISLCTLYNAADAMVIPSRQDNLPNTGLEAHACGTPVIAFNVGGLPDIVDDGVTGALAEPFEPASLASAIRSVLESPLRLRQLGYAARARAEMLWAPARIAKSYLVIYERAIKFAIK